MRKQNIKPKLSAEVKIPKKLKQFFREVSRLIKDSHEIVTTASDDLIQADFAFGGLIQDGGDRFSFTFFPAKGTEPSWTFELSTAEIASIADGGKKTLQLWRCKNANCENRFGQADDTCFECDYIDEEKEEKTSILDRLRTCKNQEEWVKAYLHHFPTAHELMIIGDYNSDRNLQKQWGSFSLTEIQALVKRLRKK